MYPAHTPHTTSATLACRPRRAWVVPARTLVLLVMCGALLFAFLTGCIGGAGSWLAPVTAREAAAVDTAQADARAAEVKAIAAARTETAKAKQAADALPPEAGLPGELTKRFVSNALPLLDQVAGPMTAEEAADLRALVADLLAGKADAEARQRAAESAAGQLSQDLAAARRELEQAQGALRTAFARENALANTLRAERLQKWGAAAGAALLAGLAWYARTFYGSGLAGVGQALAALRQGQHPAYDQFVTQLDIALPPSLQALIRKHRITAESATLHASQVAPTFSTQVPAPNAHDS